MHEHKEGGALNYDYVIDGIYIGNNQCCILGISEVLKKEGIVADISLEDKKIDQPFGVETYTWLPTPDEHPPTEDQLSFGVTVLGKLVSQNKKVYVHCQNGHGRATTLVSAYLISKGKSAKEAISFISEKRPSMHLQEIQKDALFAYEEKCKSFSPS